MLNPALVEEYRHKQPPFGFNGLGEVVYLRTYARDKDNGQSEVWVDTVERVVKGVFEVLQHHIVNKLHCTWDTQKVFDQYNLSVHPKCISWQAQEHSEDMFRRIFEMKFLPPGRGLWAMGAPVITKKVDAFLHSCIPARNNSFQGFAAALNNCAFVSTANLDKNRVHPFTFLMDASMLGVGVGFDTAGAGSFVIPGPDTTKQTYTYALSAKKSCTCFSYLPLQVCCP